jgi:fucose 4-O-acetylase-like acetyltransferase
MARVLAEKPQTSLAPLAQTPKRDVYLDALKGFAICLVVLGHSVQAYVANYDGNALFRVIYSFHMPLFMFLGGAVASLNPRPMNWKFLERKLLQLVVPFVAWYLVAYLLTSAHRTIAFGSYIQVGAESPDHGLWFLPVLFLNFCCLALVKQLTPRLKLFGYPLVWLAICLIPTGKYGIGLVRWHFPFFAAGYLLFTYRQTLARYGRATLYCCVVSFPLLAVSWHRLYYPSFVTSLARHADSSHILSVSASSFFAGSIITRLYAYVVPFAGIGFSLWLFRLKPSRYAYALLGFIGIYTLDIYASQWYFFRFAIGKSWLEIATGFILGLVMPLALGMFVLRRVPILDRLFLGGRGKPAGNTLRASKSVSVELGS